MDLLNTCEVPRVIGAARVTTMIHKVRLNDRPCDLEIPDGLAERFWYDADEKRLCFDGFMSKATFDRLENLSKDSQFRHALGELFRISVPDGAANQPGKSTALVATVTMLGIVSLGGLACWLMLGK